jgi:phytoene dehydrogenase-like protein
VALPAPLRELASREWDAVVIGGGHNGLTAAAYLALAGRSVLVLERAARLGGACTLERPFPDPRYLISPCAYVVGLLDEGVARELGLARHGYRVSIVRPDYYVPFPDGTALTLWGDLERDAGEIARFSKRDADAYLEFDRYFDRVARLLKELLFVVPPNLRVRELTAWARMAGRFRGWTGRDVAEIVRLFTLSAADFLDEWFEDDRIKGALATQAIIGAWGGPMSPGSAYVLMHHWIGEVDGHPGAWGWVRGGMGGVSEVLARAATAAGAEVRTDAPVERIIVREGGALGVELRDGSLIRARKIVSNAHPTTTFRDLVGEDHLPDEVVRDIRRFRTRSGSVKVNVALGELPKPAAWDGPVPGDPHTGLIAISPSVDYLERAWDDAKYGRTSDHPYIETVFPTAHEPGLAPEGKHVMLAFTQFGPYRLKDRSWDEEREPFGRKVVATLGQYCPNLEGAVEHMEVLAPPDLEERFGLIGGNIFHGEMAPDQMFSLRPIFGAGDYRTPIRGLYLCGSGTHPGGGVMAVPGRNCATVVIKDARRRRPR